MMFPEEMLCQCIICTQLRKYPPKNEEAMAKEETLAEKVEDMAAEIEMLTRNVTTIKRKLDVVVSALYMNDMIESVYMGDVFVPEFGGNGFKAKRVAGWKENPYEQTASDDL